MTHHNAHSRLALVMIDIQNGVLSLPLAHDPDHLVQRAAQLVSLFHHNELPVVAVNVAGRPSGRTDQVQAHVDMSGRWSELDSRLPLKADDIYVTKHCWGAFTQSTLHQQLQFAGVNQIALVGVSTSIGVESTARQAFDLGYNVLCLTDVMTDVHLDNHLYSCEHIFPRLGEVIESATLISQMN
ncbi:isochorismatase family protein [Vibrio sp. SM6]|uniref:Isochorismatase family protein n=1 Tax=Vibrio agarilyticus TaxID=2726741 RepID=A0A7X8TSZ9_9VIBR|nr:isochorismatase family protein [Vibrio agarilyticus]NLS14271.1 isochorismatase family protein [Vibrio agarilyticus]